jgi:hypothetical protein
MFKSIYVKHLKKYELGHKGHYFEFLIVKINIVICYTFLNIIKKIM